MIDLSGATLQSIFVENDVFLVTDRGTYRLNMQDRVCEHTILKQGMPFGKKIVSSGQLDLEEEIYVDGEVQLEAVGVEVYIGTNPDDPECEEEGIIIAVYPLDDDDLEDVTLVPTGADA